jgi:hypothetical protein
MIGKWTFVTVMLLVLWACSREPQDQPHKQASQVVHIEVLNAEEHLGHNITESGIHTVWCDGCRARIVTTGEPFVIYWINNQISETAFRFDEGRKYTVYFTGEPGTGVMGYHGKCIDIGQVEKVEEADK